MGVHIYSIDDIYIYFFLNKYVRYIFASNIMIEKIKNKLKKVHRTARMKNVQLLLIVWPQTTVLFTAVIHAHSALQCTYDGGRTL